MDMLISCVQSDILGGVLNTSHLDALVTLLLSIRRKNKTDGDDAMYIVTEKIKQSGNIWGNSGGLTSEISTTMSTYIQKRFGALSVHQ